ncbi:hypothetical protein BE04_35415 [Sorangium cellulosum]|uniref:Uncharacterized protein n=1 Tax=Sorangium cellulosum TaxID=56 RepID=A0A150PNK9_SORCE|nr:hypothetical protein BE04_35415 [Sorangium cellulosum]
MEIRLAEVGLEAVHRGGVLVRAPGLAQHVSDQVHEPRRRRGLVEPPELVSAVLAELLPVGLFEDRKYLVPVVLRRVEDLAHGDAEALRRHVEVPLEREDLSPVRLDAVRADSRLRVVGEGRDVGGRQPVVGVIPPLLPGALEDAVDLAPRGVEPPLQLHHPLEVGEREAQRPLDERLHVAARPVLVEIIDGAHLGERAVAERPHGLLEVRLQVPRAPGERERRAPLLRAGELQRRVDLAPLGGRLRAQLPPVHQVAQRGG